MTSIDRTTAGMLADAEGGRLTIARGEVLFHEGDEASCAFIIETGLLEIARTMNGAQVILGAARPGEMVGEMALIDNSPRSATARALHDTTLLVVPREHFEFLLKDTNPVVRGLLERFVTIIRSVNDVNLRLTLGIR
ncbi:MAG: cyclic nucleotide-binding domain-containing protein [Caenispirillum bisanense]|nr:cyclic nucleotide-binding domain-containing protein [Caenispirillum bisanense]MCA1974269.1 cyclic nucleotide-binding domain-containing protein [Caenispirillum sp.]